MRRGCAMEDPVGERDLTAEVINKIESLVIAANKKENRVIEIGGHPFKAETLTRIFDSPRPGTIDVCSLSAIVEYVGNTLEGIDPAKLFAHIVSPEEVLLLETFSGDEKYRTCYMRARLVNDCKPFEFGHWYESEAFIIALMSLFKDTEDRKVVLTIASYLVSESMIAKTDNGATMKTQASQGVINTSDAVDPGVAVLKPFRTFRQVDQPASSFLFRYRALEDKVVLTLIEADGGAWKHEAIANIQAYIEKEVPELKVIA